MKIPAPVVRSDRPARILTISATYGAGGAVAGPLLARRVGLPFADRLVDPRGTSAGASEEQVSEEELAEEPLSPILQGFALLGPTSNIPGSRDAQDVPERVRSAVEKSIAELIDLGGAVILGRAAAVVLGHRQGAFHVRLDGPPDRRALRGAAWEHCDPETARSRLAKADAVRSRYVQRLYGRDPADASLYHLVIDATVLMIDPLVEVIATAAEAAWSYDARRLHDDVASMQARLAEPPP